MSYCCGDFEIAVNHGFITDFTDENRLKYGDNLPRFILREMDNNVALHKFYDATFTFCPWCGKQQTIMVLGKEVGN